MSAIPHSTILWLAFGVIVGVMMLLDLGVFHKEAHDISVKEALTWTLVWLALSLGFSGWLYAGDHAQGLAFLTAYAVEQSLSLDNIFVFIMIFTYFRVPRKFQHKILFWGIVSAIVFRLICIYGGVALITRFHWLTYVMGAFLIFTGAKMLLRKEASDDEPDFDPGKNWLVKAAKRMLPFTDNANEDALLIRENNRWVGTPLLVVLLVIEASDLMFATDSIPAVLSISRDPLIAYTSNIFAIMGLRSMYFLLSAMMARFHYLPYGISIILIFVGIKMLLSAFHIEIAIGMTLGVVVGLIGLSVLLSVWLKKRPQKA